MQIRSAQAAIILIVNAGNNVAIRCHCCSLNKPACGDDQALSGFGMFYAIQASIRVDAGRGTGKVGKAGVALFNGEDHWYVGQLVVPGIAHRNAE